MSAPLSGKAHAAAWICTSFAILALYVITWPAVELRYTTTVTPADPLISVGWKDIRPRWVDVVYAPLHQLRDANGGRNPVSRYWWWWR